MRKLIIPKLDLHIADACNLHCEQCDHFSDLSFSTLHSPQTLRAWCEPWSSRIIPQSFHILGGEPMMNPDVVEIVYLMREMWPDSNIVLWSNGLLAKKFPDLPKALKDTNTSLQISNHSTLNSESYDRKFNEAVEVIQDWFVQYQVPTTIQFNNGEHVTLTKRGDQFLMMSNKVATNEGGTLWEKVYHGYGKSMMPFTDNDPETSWANCSAKCPQLYEGKIHKCAPLTFLPLVDKKVGGLDPAWDHYLSYKGLTPDCSDDQLEAFFNLQAESFCGMCASKRPSFFSKHNPYKIFDIKQI